MKTALLLALLATLLVVTMPARAQKDPASEAYEQLAAHQADTEQRLRELLKPLDAIRQRGLMATLTILHVTTEGVLADAVFCQPERGPEAPAQSKEVAPAKTDAPGAVKREQEMVIAFGPIFVERRGKPLNLGSKWHCELWPAGTHIDRSCGTPHEVPYYATSPASALIRLNAHRGEREK
jgi:hypothetical protein